MIGSEERYSYWRWWIKRSTSANTLRAGFFVIGQCEQATSSWSEAPSDFFCWHFRQPLHDMTLQPHLALVALKRKLAAMGKRAPRAPSIVGWWRRGNRLDNRVGSVA